MDSLPYRLLILDMDRAQFNAKTPEADDFRQVLQNLRAEGVGVLLLVDHPQEAHKAMVLGWPKGGNLESSRQIIVKSVLVSMSRHLADQAPEPREVLYVGNRSAGRIAGEEGWCRFEEVRSDPRELQDRLVEIFGTRILRSGLPRPKPREQRKPGKRKVFQR